MYRLFFIAAFASSVFCQGPPPSNSYFDAGFIRLDPELRYGSDSDGFSLRYGYGGKVTFSEVGVERLEAGSTDSIVIDASVGYLGRATEKLHVLFGAGLFIAKVDDRFGDESEVGYQGLLQIRFRPFRALQADLGGRYAEFFDSDAGEGATSGTVKVLGFITDKFAVFGSGIFRDEATGYGIGIRYAYGP